MAPDEFASRLSQLFESQGRLQVWQSRQAAHSLDRANDRGRAEKAARNVPMSRVSPSVPIPGLGRSEQYPEMAELVVEVEERLGPLREEFELARRLKDEEGKTTPR